LAVLATAGTAFAQSTVTLSGLYSVGYQRDLTNTVGNPSYAGTDVTSAAAGTTGSNAAAAVRGIGKGLTVMDANFKLAATEDLGGGLKASFDTTFETGQFRGVLVNRADSGIGLSGGFGAVAFRNTRTSDLLASIGSAAISLPDGLYDTSSILARANADTIGYTSNEIMPGLRASLTHVERGVDGGASPALATTYSIVGLSYTQGPLALTVAQKSKISNTTGSKANFELAASYDLGVAKVAVAFDGAESSTVTGSLDQSATGVSVTVPLGAITLGANYFKRGVHTQTDVGVNYALSKRTTFGASAGKQTADQTSAITGNQYRIRLAHSF